MTEEDKKLRQTLEQEGVRLLKSDNICIGEKIPFPNGIVGVVYEESEKPNADL